MISFDFNLYSTPLVFGFVQGWIYAVLFGVRSFRNGRLSDMLFGFLLAALTFEIWEYMLGFGGVEMLWQELEFFPRNFGMLLPALAWVYLKAQFNTAYRLKKKDLLHALPFGIYATYHIIVFLQGPGFVEKWKASVHFPYGVHLSEILVKLALECAYFFMAFRLYRRYRTWAPSQFSNLDAVSFKWFRNFLWAFLASSLAGWSMTLLDMWLDLDFWHDWWDELFQAGLIYYLAITGYAQTQPRSFYFDSKDDTRAKEPQDLGIDLLGLKTLLEHLMREEKPWLAPDLTLADLARRLQTNTSVLSAVINKGFGKNFNDYINDHRVEAVIQMMQDPAARHLSLLGIGLECGFNSKSTFNRAFKKTTGQAPSEYSARLGAS